MLFRSSSVAAWGAAALLSVGGGAQALTTTLPTTYLDANSVFTFNADTLSVMSLFNTTVSGLGNTTQLSGPDLAFNLPVTEVTTQLGLLPPSLTPVSGKAIGSALDIKAKNGELILANFVVDFKRNVLSADFTSAAGTLYNFDVYTFNVKDGLHLSTDGGLSMKMSLDQMYLTTDAQNRFASALKLPTFAKVALSTLDFGTLNININPSLRFGVSDSPYRASMVPELPPVAMLTLGGLAMLAVVRRRLHDDA